MQPGLLREKMKRNNAFPFGAYPLKGMLLFLFLTLSNCHNNSPYNLDTIHKTGIRFSMARFGPGNVIKWDHAEPCRNRLLNLQDQEATG